MQPLGHRRGLDGVRGIAVALVVGAHAWDLPRHSGGEMGVQIFFVLSGFLITTLLLEEHESFGAISFSRFYARRALRLLPLLYAVLGVAVVVAVLRGDEVRWYVESAAAVALYIGNVYGFLTPREGLVLPFAHLWSLAVEEQFYILWPFVLAGLLRLFGRDARRLATIIVAAIGVAALVRWLIAAHLTNGWFPLPTTYVDALLMGALLAVVRTRRPFPRVAAVSFLVLLLACASPNVDREVGGGLLLGWPTFVGCTLVVAGVTGARWLEVRPLVYLGSISYGVYVIHLPLLVIGFDTFPTWNRDLVAALAISVTLVVAAVSRRWFEQWFLARKPEPPARGEPTDRSRQPAGASRPHPPVASNVPPGTNP